MRVNPTQPFNLIAGMYGRQTMAAHLLKQGYPILLSNHVDPLSDSNDRSIYIPFIELLEELKIPWTMLSRGGKREDRLLDIIQRPIGWYVTIELRDDARSREIAPGAPTPSERLQLIDKLTARGHKVCVGINPLNPELLPDPEVLIKELAQHDIFGVWIGRLHLSDRQLKKMSDRGKEALGKAVIEQANKPNQHPEVAEHFLRTKDLCKEYGIPVYHGQMGEPTAFWDPYRQIYPKTYPLMQDFVNHCFESGLSDGDLIRWDEFRDFFVSKLPDGEWPLRDHLNAMVNAQTQGRVGAKEGGNIPRRMTYESLLRLIWNYHELLYSPANVDCFVYAGKPTGKKNQWTPYVDDEQNRVMMFKPQGEPNAFAEY